MKLKGMPFLVIFIYLAEATMSNLTFQLPCSLELSSRVARHTHSHLHSCDFHDHLQWSNLK